MQVAASETFSALLVSVLAVGNYLNSGTTNGAAAAFKMHALTKLPDTKSIDGDESLLSFISTALLDANLAPLADEIPSALSTKMEIAMEVCPSLPLALYRRHPHIVDYTSPVCDSAAFCVSSCACALWTKSIECVQ